jgi:hypothetical protein
MNMDLALRKYEDRWMMQLARDPVLCQTLMSVGYTVKESTTSYQAILKKVTNNLSPVTGILIMRNEGGILFK